MKHTKTISLIIIASLTASTLSSCGSNYKQPPDLSNNKIYVSIDQCNKDKLKDCELHYKKASTNHLLRSPKYVTKEQCEKNGHEKCVDISLEDATIWLPKMVGFMENDRPIYLKKLSKTTTTVEVEGDDGSVWEEERNLTAAELKEREVVAGPSNQVSDTYDNNSVVILGGWYPSPMYYSHGFSPGYSAALYDGMGKSQYRSTGSRSFNTQSAHSASSFRGNVSRSSVRGGFGRAGGGFGSGG